MESVLRWVSNDKVDRVTMWMLRRLFKLFLKKYIGPYIRGELDLEQLDFQLCSGAHLKDVALNVDAINAKLGDHPILLKEGSVGRVTVKLLPKLNIEVDGVELHFVPRKAPNVVQSKTAPSESTPEAQRLESDSESVGLSSAGGYSYLPVQEGVRVVANLFERLFFGAHVIINQAYIAIEEMPKMKSLEDSSPASHCMLLVRVGCAEYTASRSVGSEGDRQGEEFSSFTSDINFQEMTFELVELHSDGCEGSRSVTGDTKVFGQPVSLFQDGDVLSGNMKLSIRSKNGSLDVPKMDADITLAHIKLQFTMQQIQQILGVVSSYRDSSSSSMTNNQSQESNERNAVSNNDLLTARIAAEMVNSRETITSKPAMLGSQSKSSRPSLLPGAKLIADWVHWSDHDKYIGEAVMSEEEFAASTEEFFDCLSGSGLWLWTCSAFSAISAASSLASGSVLLSQEFTNQVTYLVKVKIAGLSIILKEGKADNHAEVLPGVCNKNDKIPMPPRLGSVITGSDCSKDDHIEAIILDIDLSLQVCQKDWKWQLNLKQIEAYQVKYREEDVFLTHAMNGDICPEIVSQSRQPLQALVEQSLPKFPVSLCQGKETAKASTVTRKCFLRLLDQSQEAGVQVNAKHKFSSTSSGDKSGKLQDLTEIGFRFQPIVVWLDASIISMLHRWTESSSSSVHDSEGSKSACSSTGSSLASRRKIHLNVFFSRVRLLACSPCSPGSRILKDHLLCLDVSSPAEYAKRPMVKLRLSNMSQTKGEQLGLNCLNLALEESFLYLVSPTIEGFGGGPALGFIAHKVLSIWSCSRELATVEILLRTRSGGGIWLAERAWTGVTEQQKGGMGGRKTNAEFAAATATEMMDENNLKIREDILLYSYTSILVSAPCVKLDLHTSQHDVVVGIFMGLFEASLPKASTCGDSVEKTGNQISFSLKVGEAEIIVYPELEASMSSEKKGSSPWERYTINITKFEMLHAVNLGMINNASYFWLRHGNGCLKGSLVGASHVELPLLTCRDKALGRGDGGGGNALATGLAGIELSVISWPKGGHAEDMLITVIVAGCTFMAHGGRLDGLPGLITFFSQHADKGFPCYGLYEKTWGHSVNETCLLKLQDCASETKNEPAAADNYVLFSLDFHDAALCYEPGEEAVSAANLRAKSLAEPQDTAIEQFSPVACLLAAAAVRVSSNAISNTASKDYEIWLRDVALLLSDTTLRKNSALDYTPESLLQAGYVKVAGEAVMEAVVHVNGEEGLDWEVECANNQFRLDTCTDTTAALGRLIAQLQQLFVPDVECPVMEKRSEPDADGCCSRERFGLLGSTEESAARIEGFLQDAFILVEESSLRTDRLCNCLDLEVKIDEKYELLSKSTLLSDDITEGSLHSSMDQWSRDDDEVEDFRTPVSQNEQSQSFIEDYYVTKKSSLQSSQNSSCKDSGASVQSCQHPSDEFDLLSAVDGNGGWYDGPSFKVGGGWYDGHRFKVVENHVTAGGNRSGSKKQTGNLLQTSKKKLGVSLKYPQSVGRVSFQDLKIRWRLYGGSDWPVYSSKDAFPYASQAAGGRQVGVCLEVFLNGVDLQHDTFPETGAYASRLALSIRDVRIYDCSKDAPWKKILGYHRSKSRPRESSAKALKLELESVRPDPMVPLEEYRLSVQLLPLLLHLDQRHIDFLTNFFPPASPSSQQLHLGYEEIVSPYSNIDTKVAEGFEEALLPFFQSCELQPFSVRVDYVPRRVDIGSLRAGNYAELANLVSWKGIELELKHVRATAVHGWGTLSGIVVGEWLEDISRNQVHKLLKGLGPIRPLFAVGSGAAKLVVLPAEHYKKDRRRLLRGMRKGAVAFLRSISLEAVGLGVQLASGAHGILLQTESALGSVGLSSSFEKVEVRGKVGQPGDMREGLQQACESLSQGLERTASSLIGNPLKVYHRGAGTSTAVASALRAAPAATVAPAAAAVGALHRALLGVRNSLDPEHRMESEEKHSGPPPE